MYSLVILILAIMFIAVIISLFKAAKDFWKLYAKTVVFPSILVQTVKVPCFLLLSYLKPSRRQNRTVQQSTIQP